MGTTAGIISGTVAGGFGGWAVDCYRGAARESIDDVDTSVVKYGGTVVGGLSGAAWRE